MVADEELTSSGAAVNGSDSESEETSQEDHGGDYTTRLEELLSDGEHDSDAQSEDEEEEGFCYTGVDADLSTTYKDQLRDVLGPDHEEDEAEEVEVEHSLLQEVAENENFAAAMEDEARHPDHYSETSDVASPSSDSGFLLPPRITVSETPDPLASFRKPFLHPSISRLRSITPQSSRSTSAGSAANDHTEVLSAAPSHFSALSKGSISAVSHISRGTAHEDDREVFRWTQLRHIGENIYGNHPMKALTVLGSQVVGSPTVLAANGLICIGTDMGKTLVFDFKQNLKCICGENQQVGPVTALALSFDHTFVASGHASGHIQLFDLQNPKVPARFVPPTSLSAVASGRQEGHLLGSRIVSIGFVAGRHTAIVSADDNGLAFFHSLGKVLFVEASDVLRILGKYPDDDPSNGPSHLPFRRRKLRKANTILSMAPMPLGTAPHPTDAYNLIALLTPVKLVIVGLKPEPKTWYRRLRETDDESAYNPKTKGTLAWFPSVIPGQILDSDHKARQNASKVPLGPPPTAPMLVYSWGNVLNLIRVSETKFLQKSRNPRTGKTKDVEVGRIVFEEVGRWTSEGDVLAIQWLNFHTLKLVEFASFDAWTLVSPILSHTTNGVVSYPDAVTEVAHSVRIYKGKIFLLGQHEVKVGTLLTWADRILAFVEEGDFLSAIELTRSYLIGEAPGNRNGLPDKPEEYRRVVSEKMRELMVASAGYAFSEDRFTDGTHVTPDGRGVDRTSLFEGLVVTCTRACIALEDLDFLFEDLFQYYDNFAISRIYLVQLEPFILEGRIHEVPPRITQRLVAMHHEDGRPDLVERVIWHIDPECLDVNQAITLCQQHRLYDALIYVFTRALKDYEAPLVELISLIRRVQQFRKARLESSPATRASMTDDVIESDVLHAYKVYPYLANILTGLAYPSEQPLPEDEANQAKSAVYTFLFDGRSRVWPAGDDGKLILTSDEENGVEPTFPYTRLLLKFDAESFLHTLDIAFEDPYMNDKSLRVNRLVIVKILFEILTSPSLSPTDATFINIFIARNVPKYVQYIELPPSDLHSVLVGLADASDENTREDRQLAAEYLLSAYTPHDHALALQLYQNAGFYRILRSSHLHERRWVPLLDAWLQDPDLRPSEVCPSVEDVLNGSSRYNRGKIPSEVSDAVAEALPLMLQASITRTASLIDRRLPQLHERAFDALATSSSHDRLVYLRFLLGSPQNAEDEFDHEAPRQYEPSSKVPPSLRRHYISLLCKLDPSVIIHELQYLPPDFFEWTHVQQTCEDHEVYDAVVWSFNFIGQPVEALRKADDFNTLLSRELTEGFEASEAKGDFLVTKCLSALQAIGSTGVAVCTEHSQTSSSSTVKVEDLWYELLRSQIGCVHRVALFSDNEEEPTSSSLRSRSLASLRALVQDTFSSLMSINTHKAVSFPRLFKRLVDSVAGSHESRGAIYNEFRVILTGMLESYRSEGDMLVITKHLVDRDLFRMAEDLATERSRGWSPYSGSCSTCKKALHENKPAGVVLQETANKGEVIVSRTGAIYHAACFPSSNGINVQ